MYKNLRWKFLVIAAVTGLAIWAFTPPSRKVKLGLDLKGGVHFVLGVKTDDALRLETETSSEQLRTALKDAGITVTTRVTGLTDFVVEGVPPTSDQQFRTIADQQTGTSFDREAGASGQYTFRLKPNVIPQTRALAVTLRVWSRVWRTGSRSRFMRRRRCAIAGCRSGVGSPLAAEGGARVISNHNLQLYCDFPYRGFRDVQILHRLSTRPGEASHVRTLGGPNDAAVAGDRDRRGARRGDAAHRQGALAVTFNLIVRARSSSAMAAFRRSNTSIATQLREGIF